MAKTRASVASAKGKVGKKDIDSFTIRGTNKVVRAGDNVLMRPAEGDNIFPYVARVEKIEADASGNVMVHIRWYYRPEDTRGGRREFHGAKEIFISDHFDFQSANTIEEKCVVHSFKKYVKFDSVAAEDYYCRFEFKPLTDAFIPDRVSVYCTCEMPYNPDILMVQCELCKEWYHPACVGMTIEEAKKLEHFACTECMSNEDCKRYMNVLALSPNNSHKRKQNEEEEDEQASGSMFEALSIRS